MSYRRQMSADEQLIYPFDLVPVGQYMYSLSFND